ncbi:MAG: Methylcrotonyl-CoA carboxylase biotin-containing subunit, partial [Bacteroidota bacterium]|nr:Methylcrotonyl-CoA carboxylase biotin-containing subunit [Bacteroidota bacterium]
QEKYSFGGFEFPVEYTNNNGELNISFADKHFISKVCHLECSERPRHNIVLEINGIKRKFYFSQTGNQYFVHSPALGQIVLLAVNRFPNPNEETVKGGYIAPMPGEVTKVLVNPGDIVKSGDALIVMLSMKMENTIEAHTDGIVEEVYVTGKQFVEGGTLLLKMKEEK